MNWKYVNKLLNALHTIILSVKSLDDIIYQYYVIHLSRKSVMVIPRDQDTMQYLFLASQSDSSQYE